MYGIHRRLIVWSVGKLKLGWLDFDCVYHLHKSAIYIHRKMATEAK